MRLFLAFEVPSELKEDLDRHTRPRRRAWPRARWVKPASMHLTLVFLGDTDGDRIPALGRALRPTFASWPAMEMRLTGVDAFPPRGRARTLWVGLSADGDLLGLQQAVRAAVEETLGIETEKRPFRPHLTLARCQPPWPRRAVDGVAETLLEAGPLGSFRVSAGVLYRSELHPDGARYTVLDTYPLGELPQ